MSKDRHVVGVVFGVSKDGVKGQARGECSLRVSKDRHMAGVVFGVVGQESTRQSAGRTEPLTMHKPPLMNCTYLYDYTQPDFTDFTGGRLFTQDEVYADIGSPEHWAHREIGDRPMARTPEQAAEVAELLRRCLAWEEHDG